jgi:hypothetical protein
VFASSGPFAACERPLQTPEKARPLSWDPVVHSHREVYDLPLANARVVDRLPRMAFVGAHI